MSKKLFLLPAFILGAFLMVTSTSCGDKCKDKDCVSGTCLDGTCECDPGYEYDAKGICNVEVRAKLLGNFTVSETDPNCSGDPDPYIATFSEGSAVTEVKIANFYGSGGSSFITATVSNDSKLTIPNQALGLDFTVSGNGTIEVVSGKAQLTMNYTIYQAGVSVAQCSNVVWTK